MNVGFMRHISSLVFAPYWAQTDELISYKDEIESMYFFSLWKEFATS